MRILGISAFYHDSAAALVEDGYIIAAAQEERFTRKKQDARYPENAIRYCLEEGALCLDELDYIVFYEKPFLKFERLLETYLAFAPRGFASFRMALPLWLKEKLFQKDLLGKRLKARAPGFDWHRKLLFAEHHRSHAASAFYPSPFDEALILTIDGVGEWATTSAGIGRNHGIEMLKEIQFPHSLGLLYAAFTYYTGFKVNSGEYKMMGLAPYGEPIYADLIKEKLIDIRPDGSFRMNMDYFAYPHIHETTKVKNLCLAGGVALNCVANGRILREGPYRDIWIQPAAGDAGGALGAALAAWHQYHEQTREPREGDAMQGSFLGPQCEENEIRRALDSAGARYQRLDDGELMNRVAEVLATENVVGWVQGRMEFGPRALGARSILGDPRSPRMQSVMNLKIKYRESFRPFAPAVLGESVSDYFDLDRSSPYMLLVAPVKGRLRRQPTSEEQRLLGIYKLKVPRSSIPAVTHVDYSARVQTVHRETNPRFHELLRCFAQKTGCAALVNTSFNIRGEPIVCSPEDAYRCFMRTEMDYLAIGNFLLSKQDQPQHEPIDRSWDGEYEPD